MTAQRLHANNIQYGKPYYSVTCGNIAKIIFIEKIDHKWVRIRYESNKFEVMCSFADLGIVYYGPDWYANTTNYTFETEAEAISCIHDPAYKETLNVEMSYF